MIQTLRSVRFHEPALFDYFATIISAFVLTAISDLPVSLATVLLFSLHFQNKNTDERIFTPVV